MPLSLADSAKLIARGADRDTLAACAAATAATLAACCLHKAECCGSRNDSSRPSRFTSVRLLEAPSGTGCRTPPAACDKPLGLLGRRIITHLRPFLNRAPLPRGGYMVRQRVNTFNTHQNRQTLSRPIDRTHKCGDARFVEILLRVRVLRARTARWYCRSSARSMSYKRTLAFAGSMRLGPSAQVRADCITGGRVRVQMPCGLHVMAIDIGSIAWMTLVSMRVLDGFMRHGASCVRCRTRLAMAAKEEARRLRCRSLLSPPRLLWLCVLD